jgi:uncharacterized protein (TIGR02452 family)
MTNNKSREARSALAQDTVRITRCGCYTVGGLSVNIAADVTHSRENSVYLTAAEVAAAVRGFSPRQEASQVELRNESTLAAILRLVEQRSKPLGVLNFASAKNPGGGFLGGALAQEESLAAASSLYDAQLAFPAYYEANRACRSMVYTDGAIWSPDVVFFRDDSGALLPVPVKASVLTLPAVNYGQVIAKNEDTATARLAMKRRLKIALAIFAKFGCTTVVLGAYGCGVFRNDPVDVAQWWEELLQEYGGHFRHIVFAVLDRSQTGAFPAFRQIYHK